MTFSKKSIVLLSGGMDSALALVYAKKQSSVQFALTFDYGQKSAQKEIEAAKKIAEYYHVDHKTITLPFFSELTEHPFFHAHQDCPRVNQNQLDDKTITEKTAQAVWVPNRNGVFLNIAAAMAESLKIASLYTGFNAEEAATFPDNSKDYLASLNHCLTFSTLNHVRVESPAMNFFKKEIFRELLANDFPLSLLWSCYHGHEKMCGRCESCQRFKRAATQNLWAEKVKDLFE